MTRQFLGGLSAVIAASLVLAACGDANTNFEDKPAGVVRIKLTVEPDGDQGADSIDADGAAGTSADAIADDGFGKPLDEDAVEEILTALDQGYAGGTAGGEEGGTADSTGSDPSSGSGSESGIQTGDESGTFAGNDSDDNSGSNSGGNTAGDPGKEGPLGDIPSGDIGTESGSGSGSGPDSGSVPQISDSERRACADLVGVPVDRVKVTGNQSNVTMSSSSAVAIKVAGNQSHVELHLEGADGVSIKGVCLFVTGNKGQAAVSSNIDLGAFLYIGRGNTSSGTLDIREGATLNQAYVDLSGNQASLTMKGDGSFSCPTARLRGHDAAFNCQ